MLNLVRILIIALFCWSLGDAVMAKEAEEHKIVKEIPMGVELMSEALKTMPDMGKKVGYFTWPSAEKISARLRQSDESLSIAEKKRAIPRWLSREKETVTEAKRMAEKWIRTILKDRWIPTDIYSRLVALDSDIDGYDAIRVRYQIDTFYIQIVQTNPRIAIMIKPTDGRRLLPEQVIDLFFIRSHEIKENTLSQVESLPGGCSRAQPPDPIKNPESRNEYWGNTYWWSDGESFAFLIFKFYGGKGRPVGLPKDWF